MDRIAHIAPSATINLPFSQTEWISNLVFALRQAFVDAVGQIVVDTTGEESRTRAIAGKPRHVKRGASRLRYAVAICAFAVTSWASTAIGAEKITIQPSDAEAKVRVDGDLFAEYQTRSGHQPAIWSVRGPNGLAMTRSYPIGPQLQGEMVGHPHHRSV